MTVADNAPSVPQDLLRRLQENRLGDPFQLLGRRPSGKSGTSLRVWRPGARRVHLHAADGPELQRIPDSDLFVAQLAGTLPRDYRLHWQDAGGAWHSGHDAYAFDEPLIADFDLHLFGEGRHWHVHKMLGAHPLSIDGVAGVRFAVWAPHALAISVVGDFNAWDGRIHLMRGHGSGVWQLFIPDLPAGAFYKFEICGADGARRLKSDPYGREFQLRPETASVIGAPSQYPWADAAWLQARQGRDYQREPMSVYEVHLGSWQRSDDNGYLSYREIAQRLVPYVVQLGFTHIELLPISEHPFDGSWGYQTIGLYAPTSRHGSPDDFRYLVDQCHASGIGVILDWVPAHFPKDAHGLRQFDGQPLYEYPDPLRGEHPEWGTLVYDYGRPQVRNFLLANALFWIELFHIDGLRVDAVASMLYLDYGRNAGEWKPNQLGGREHLEAVDFLRDLNIVVHGQHPGAVVIAEESTSWPKVSRPVDEQGLGFSMKWDMGWMHDTLDYFKCDPLYRRYDNNKMTFGLMYAWTESFVLPLSHDEVVHLKKALVEKMPGDDWQKFANLRLLYAWMYTRPGKKLLFMGGEFGQRREWNHDRPLDWWLDTQPLHAGLRGWLSDLNHLHRDVPAFHERDFEPGGFDWIDCNNLDESVFVYRRRDRSGRDSVVVLNCTPVVRHRQRIGVPSLGRWIERLNSDAPVYGGSGVGNLGVVEAFAAACMNQPCTLELSLPPLGALVLSLEEPVALKQNKL
ncbi:MAG: alpha,4-glucan:alpha,4-glucan 6-glycosyltransferase [Hydrocarboniphaga sp.]|uniref:1,4-alpha-glucan branching protein GlgB n=1 Tax=Hydrocarboniphaga sp. TaxID=2033016 RepID=UPI0026078C79|nr:1,4-alpha-glucan branching protein GlgB [Hydrocarboniphaga sp.]MDB5973005.1 alpha,4-glucan:alpha,4-glucan 6-glycosyltransferase [Hydrocarboniphaga sp.]